MHKVSKISEDRNLDLLLGAEPFNNLYLHCLISYFHSHHWPNLGTTLYNFGSLILDEWWPPHSWLLTQMIWE